MLKIQHFGYVVLKKAYRYYSFQLSLLTFFNVTTRKFRRLTFVVRVTLLSAGTAWEEPLDSEQGKPLLLT